MDEIKTKPELLNRMQLARAEWEQTINQVPRRWMCEPILHDGWSVKDTIGHVAYYERWLLGWLESAVRGKVTLASHRDVLNVDQRNVLIRGENKDRPLAEILRESRNVYERLFQFAQTLPEQDLIEPHRFERYVLPFWQESRPLWKCIAVETYEHYPEHVASIRSWLEQFNRDEHDHSSSTMEEQVAWQPS
jgi:hypothetical protein